MLHRSDAVRRRLGGGLVVAFAALLITACPSPPAHRPTPPTPQAKPPSKPEITLEDVPSELKSEKIGPMDGNDPSARSPILDVMATENERSMSKLRTAKPFPAYYMEYAIHQQRLVAIEAEGGALVNTSDNTDRYMDVEVRVGSPALDNRHTIPDDTRGVNDTLSRQVYAPFGEDKEALENALWVETDRRYREAAQQFFYVKQDRKLSSAEKGAPDFVHEKKEVYVEKRATLAFDKDAWTKRIKECSKKALRGYATRGSCSVLFELNTMWFVNSEGTQLQLSWTSARIGVSVGVKADDGQSLSRLEQRFARNPDGLPGDDVVDKMIEKASTDLDALYKAPRVDPYVGPAILEGRATGVFFHEVFGHRIEGHRQKERTSGRTFTAAVGKEIMPDWINIYDDPTLNTLNGVVLNGFYRFDDEGVRAQRASLVRKGVLEGFDMGRNPIPGFLHSNGHGRKQLGRTTVSRQGNLVVEATKSVTDEKLHQMLLDEIKRQHKPFGLIFTDIQGGFTLTTTDLPQSFKVEPVMAYRLYPDGHKQLVRGIDIVGTPLTALGNILAAGRKVETFNGMCGAESGWVPVSASAPALLIKTLETERKAAPMDRQPILPPPSVRQDVGGGAR